jgi:hypothetical protein
MLNLIIKGCGILIPAAISKILVLNGKTPILFLDVVSADF